MTVYQSKVERYAGKPTRALTFSTACIYQYHQNFVVSHDIECILHP